MSKATDLLRYGREEIPYELVPSVGRKTLGIEVRPDLRVVVRVPPESDATAVRLRIKKRAKWISRQLGKFKQFTPRTPPRRYVAGESHRYLGRHYKLKLVPGDPESVMIRDGAIVVSSPKALTPNRVRDLLLTWYRKRARSVFSDTLIKCFRRCDFGTSTCPDIAIRSMAGRWGSLSVKGRMTLNSNLIQASRSCIEYVVTHELCHLRHNGHSVMFYRQLEKLIPDWESRKQRLETSLL